MKKKRNSLLYKSTRPLVQAKRFVFNRRGDGVHSPYAFHLITKVIRNPYPYDCFRFLAPKYSEQAKRIKRTYGDRAVHSIKTAELIFRLATFHRAEDVCLFAHKESILEPYLLATSKVKTFSWYKLEEGFEAKEVKLGTETSLIILEDLTEDREHFYLDCLAQQIEAQQEEGKELMLIISTNNPFLRKRKQPLITKLKPVVSLSLLGLEVFIWRKAITKGRYSVYSKF